MDQSCVTLVFPFAQEHLVRVAAYLDALGNPARADIQGALDRTELIHFMGIHALPAEAGGSANLVFELAIDGPVDLALQRLEQQFAKELRSILMLAGFSPPATALAQYLKEARCTTRRGLFGVAGLEFVGTPGFSVTRIQREAQLASRLTGELARRPLDEQALSKVEAIRARLWDGGLRRAFGAEPLPYRDAPAAQGWASPVARVALSMLWPALVPPVLCAAVLFAMGYGALPTLAGTGLVLFAELALLGALYLRFRRAERRDAPDSSMPDASAMADILQREDVYGQNHLIVLCHLKPGRLRRFTLRLAFSLVEQLVKLRFAPGFLSDIGTIHFARWLVLPGTSQLVFFSNYGGSWESYLEDFIAKASEGLTGIWSNTLEFPATKHLIKAGATDGARFKTWARRMQRPTAFWYSAYPTLSTTRIRANARLCQDLATIRTEDDARRWLTQFVSPPGPNAKPPNATPNTQEPARKFTIEGRELPTLVHGGLPRLPHAKALIVRLPARAREWLAQVAPLVTFGRAQGGTALALAFTATGLRKLGLNDRQMRSFPVAFQHGSALRGRALGDVGESDPENWWWGGPRDSVDAVLLLYAVDREALHALERKLPRASGRREERVNGFELRSLLEEAGVDAEVHRGNRRAAKEPFGFADGLSQPALRGIRDADGDASADQVLEPGEIVLGYRDGRGFFPDTPTVDEGDDRDEILVRPAGIDASALGGGARDLGQNGTFLVVRQLEQNVARYRTFLEESAAALRRGQLKHNGLIAEDVELRDWIAAKMMGRWPNGSSLVQHPKRPGEDPIRNEFCYGETDASGQGCPFGAHTRRTNPRDSFDGSDPTARAIVNRHRILRVGRAYVPPHGTPPGLMFMCLNADIERQFEFIQKTWLCGRSFHGLANEADPIVGHTGDADSIVLSVPTEQGPVFIRGRAGFVTVRGAGYFFMPGRRALSFLAQAEAVPVREAAE